MTKLQSRAIFAHAVKSGRLVRPKRCEQCGRCPRYAIQGHHTDYDKPLEVQWLCRPCHDSKHSRELPPSGPRTFFHCRKCRWHWSKRPTSGELPARCPNPECRTKHWRVAYKRKKAA